jgi:hypothetical protein
MNKPYTPRHGSNAEKAVNILRQHNRAMRTPEIAEISGMSLIEIGSALEAPVKHGLVTVCKITNAAGSKTSEYRIGSGVPMVSQGSYQPGKKLVTAIQRPTPIMPKPAQPAVASALDVRSQSNTGSDPQVATSLPAEVAVAAIKATPKPKAKVRELGPASQTASAGNDVKIIIDQDGAVSLYNDEFTIDLTPAQALAVGDFFHATQDLWRP